MGVLIRSELIEPLERLLGKYRSLGALRARRETAEAAGMKEFGTEEVASRTVEFRRVAREFPGALRELEISSARVFETRAKLVAREIEALRRGAPAVSPACRWMVIAVDYHATLREALAVKRWLSERVRGGGELTPGLLSEFLEWHGSYPHRHSLVGPAGIEFLEAHRRPPGGRLHSLVWEALAKKHGLTRRELERAVFGPIDEEASGGGG